MSVTALLLIFAVGVLAVVFRLLVRRGLAPERVVERATPADCGLEFDEASIATANARQLFGWWLPAGTAAKAPAVAVLHGWGGNAEMMLPLARPLHEAGFAVLLFDARCHGRSDEDSFASLPRFAEDLEGAVDWLRRQPGVDPARVAVLGHSVGAGAALLVAARRTGIAAVVSLAAFAHPAAMMRRWLAAKRIPYLPLGWLILRYVEQVIGQRFDAIAPVTTIGRIRCPTLLLHGAADTIVPLAEMQAIHAARSGDHVECKVIAGSHDDYGDIGSEVPALVAFLRRSLGVAEHADS